MEGCNSQLDCSARAYTQSVRTVDRITDTRPGHDRFCVSRISEDSTYQERLIKLLQAKRL